jgi:hypothetical protein
MVGRNTETYEAIGHRQMLVHIDDGIVDLREHFVGCVEASWAGAYDGHAEGAAILGGMLGAIPAAR